MKKMKLDFDALTVETFETGEDAAKREGTVKAHAETLDGSPTCNGGNTCWDSCDGVCGSYFCVPTEGNSCQQVTCIWSCSTCNQSCSCVPGCPATSPGGTGC